LLVRTPCAAKEVTVCRETYSDTSLSVVERARRYYVHLCQSFGGTGTSMSRSSKKNYAKTFANRVDQLDEVADRFRNVFIENNDVLGLIDRYDDSGVLWYVDPPYWFEGESRPQKYQHTYTREQHIQLMTRLNRIKGKALVSGYDTELYRKHLKGWRVCWKRRITSKDSTDIHIDTAERYEVLWANF
jgi:site-specific DNA-adenine methylase